MNNYKSPFEKFQDMIKNIKNIKELQAKILELQEENSENFKKTQILNKELDILEKRRDELSFIIKELKEYIVKLPAE
jgi:hypothetical protein